MSTSTTAEGLSQQQNDFDSDGDENDQPQFENCFGRYHNIFITIILLTISLPFIHPRFDNKLFTLLPFVDYDGNDKKNSQRGGGGKYHRGGRDDGQNKITATKNKPTPLRREIPGMIGRSVPSPPSGDLCCLLRRAVESAVSSLMELAEDVTVAKAAIGFLGSAVVLSPSFSARCRRRSIRAVGYRPRC